MNIGFVFTNYNNCHFTKDLVKSIENLGGNNLKKYVVIVDNNSNEGESNCLNSLSNLYDYVNIIYNKENVGYFKGLNIGLQYLYQKGLNIDFIIIGNNDLYFPENLLEKIIHKHDLFNVYPVICPDIVTLDNVHQNPHVIKKISAFREVIYDLYYSNYFIAKMIQIIAKLTNKLSDRKDESFFNISQEIYQGYGACYILGKIFIEQYKYFNSPTFLMGEELFLSLQLKEKGHNFFYESSICVNHHDHATVSKLPAYKFWKISKESHKIYRNHVPIFSKTK